MKIPVTWALDPALHGTSRGTKAEVIVGADVDVFRRRGRFVQLPLLRGQVTSTMTADQNRTDGLKALRRLQQRGHAGRM